MLKKRIDIHTSSPNNGLLEFQSAVQGGYVVDITNRGGVARRGLHIFLEMIKATPVETKEEEEVDVKVFNDALNKLQDESLITDEVHKDNIKPTTPKRNTAKKSTTEDVKEDAK